MRDGAPLPGLTPAQLVSQLAHRVFGPLHPRRTRIVLDYHGLLDHPAGSLAVIAARHRVSTGTVSNYVAAVRGAGARQPLSAPVLAAATRVSAPGEDHPGRVRIATTLGLPAPAREAASVPGSAAAVVSVDRRAAARTALRVLAAVGPLDTQVLTAAVTRSRRFRTQNPLTDNDLGAALTAVGCTLDPTGRWQPLPGTVPTGRDRVIVTRAAGRNLTRRQMIDILLAAGYSENSATGRMSSSHPLFQRTGPDRYGLIGQSGSARSVGRSADASAVLRPVPAPAVHAPDQASDGYTSDQ